MKTTYIKFSSNEYVSGKDIEYIYSVVRVTRANILVKILDNHSAKYSNGEYIKNPKINIHTTTLEEYKKNKTAQVSQYSYLY